jgi:hypothetical protein
MSQEDYDRQVEAIKMGTKLKPKTAGSPQALTVSQRKLKLFLAKKEEKEQKELTFWPKINAGSPKRNKGKMPHGFQE